MNSVQRLVELVRVRPPRCGGTRLACIDGRSGSGKTTFAGRLAAGLGAPVLHLDDVYPGWDGLGAAIGLVADGVVAPLVAGHAAGYRRWDWVRGAPADVVELGRPGVLVVEGVGSGARVIAGHSVLLVWTEAPDDLRRRRGLARDGETYRPHWERWAAQEDTYLAAEDPRARADVVIDTT